MTRADFMEGGHNSWHYGDELTDLQNWTIRTSFPSMYVLKLLYYA